jgi:hypothetical protein
MDEQADYSLFYWLVYVCAMLVFRGSSKVIDYEKLKFCHEIAKKLPYGWYSITLSEGTGACCNYLTLCFEDEEIMSHEYDFLLHEIDHLIAKLQELTQPKQKYEKGQEVWFLGEENQLCNDEITHSEMGGQNYIYYLLHYEGLFHESILYPTKQSLIESQIKYWQSMLEPKEEYCEVSGAKLDTKCPHGITPRNCPDCVLPECQHENIGRPGDVWKKCNKCGQITWQSECQHDKNRCREIPFMKFSHSVAGNTYYIDTQSNEVMCECGIEADFPHNCMCKKCGEFYR